MTTIGTTAMVLAAGYGARMRPLTETRPKPLIEVSGKPLIGYGFDRLREAGVTKAVVNVHYLPDQIEAWVRRQSSPAIEISDERAELLDTGGGIVKALPKLGRDPFFVINSDSFWIDGQVPALDRLCERWDDGGTDCVLLLCPVTQTVGYDGVGDFVMVNDGRLLRRGPASDDALVYVGAYLVHPRLFENAPVGKFSINLLWDRAIAQHRLFGVQHTGKWIHVGTPSAIAQAERTLRGSG